MITNCSHCVAEVDDEEVGHCDVCDEDGLCSDCLPHEFHGKKASPARVSYGRPSHSVNPTLNPTREK